MGLRLSFYLITYFGVENIPGFGRGRKFVIIINNDD